ncbi:hypothetical protein QBC44DRAFT_314777 [Cladorrhinum sp. PSN332]|nr:hypothetical protein QBC44DRAFT_314777 [Cladorrhinum sp. PSN332]
MPPTATFPGSLSHLLTARQATTTVVVDNNNGGDGGLDAGAIVGIVLGTIAGILLLGWIIYACSRPRGARGAGPRHRDEWYDEPAPRRSRSRSASRHSRRGHHHHHHHSSGRRRSTSRPVVLEEKIAYGVPVAAPAAVYYSGDSSARRASRSRSRGRYYEGY